MPRGNCDALAAAVDVAILGAGFTGLCAARQLAGSGASVLVLEARTIGWGASCRNGGMVLTGTKLPVETLVRRYGLDLARRMYQASIASIDLVEQIIRDEAIACSFARCGHLEVACKPSHFDAYSRSVELMAAQFGHSQHMVPRADLGAEIGSRIYYGGLVDETSAGLNPAGYVAGLARAAMKAGASIAERCSVERIEKTRADGRIGFELVTARGRILARDVLIATSGYTSRATPQVQRKIIPIGSFIIATEPLSESLARELSPRNRMIYDSRYYLHYYRLTPDNRMLFGGRAAFFPETQNTVRKSAQILRDGMVSVYPQLRHTKIEYAWGGTLDFCFDTMPHAGRLDGLYYSVGYAGHGVAMASWLGTEIAKQISSGTRPANLAGSPDFIPYSQIPFPGAPLGLYNGRPWFLPLAGAYYKILDWIS